MSSNFQRAPKVSVLIPVYNGAPFLAAAIESVLRQTLLDFELVIADDRSTDGSQKIIERYAKEDSRIVFRQNEINLGCVRNINSLALQARGDYLKYLIQDDLLAPNCLEICARILDTRRKVALVTSFQKFVGDRDDVRKLPTLPAIGELEGRLVQRHLLKYGNWIGGETAVMLRQSSLVAGLFNPDWVWKVDQDMWLRILANSNLYVVPQILTFPRVHRGQNTFLLDTGFTFVKEEIMQLKVAFMFPEVYGAYSESEQEELIAPALSRLIQKGIESPSPKARREMVEIGSTLVGHGFQLRLARNYLDRLMTRILRTTGFLRLAGFARSRGRRVMRALLWGRRFKFRTEIATVDIGYGSVQTIGSMWMPMEMLRSPIMTPAGFKVVKLNETPHFMWIRDLVDGNDDGRTREAYRQYLSLYHLDDDADSTIRKIVALVNSIRSELDRGDEPEIVTHPPSNYEGADCAVIYDGNHRACISKALGRSRMKCRIVEIDMADSYYPPRIFEAKASEGLDTFAATAS